MSVATVTNRRGESLKLGAILPLYSYNVGRARVSVYPDGRTKVTAALGAHSVKPSAGVIPGSCDYGSKASASLSQMMKNNQLGCCVISGEEHIIGVVTGNDGPSCVVASDNEVVEMYHTICGPGDNGCIISDVLDYKKSTGMKAGGSVHRIDNYVHVNNANKQLIQAAIYIFGNLTLGINLPGEWANNAEPGFVWDNTNSRPVGGHEIIAFGYDDRGIKVSTWGTTGTVTWEALANSGIVTECFTQLTADWYGDDKLSPCGIKAADLVNDLKSLENGVIPGVDPGPGPGPLPPSPTGQYSLSGTLTVPGMFWTRTGTFTGVASPSTAAGAVKTFAFNWLALVTDLMQLARDYRSGASMQTIESDVVKLLADQGINIPWL